MNEMILRESEDESILDYSENINSAGKTLLSLINSILDFSKIEDGIFEFQPDEEDMEIEASQENNDKKRTYDTNRIAETGIDISSGLNYCAKDEELYFEILGDFASSLERKLDVIDRLFREENWKEYEVAVHALKSNSRTIGANDLYEKARELEEYAEIMDAGNINLRHDTFLKCARQM